MSEFFEQKERIILDYEKTIKRMKKGVISCAILGTMIFGGGFVYNNFFSMKTYEICPRISEDGRAVAELDIGKHTLYFFGKLVENDGNKEKIKISVLNNYDSDKLIDESRLWKQSKEPLLRIKIEKTYPIITYAGASLAGSALLFPFYAVPQARRKRDEELKELELLVL